MHTVLVGKCTYFSGSRNKTSCCEAPAAVTANRNISTMLSVNQKKKLAKINYFLQHFLKAAKCQFFRLSGRVSKAGSLP